MKHRSVVALACAACLLPALAHAQIRIGPDRGAAPPGGNEAFSFGEQNGTRSIIGQTFTVPTAASVLTNFSFVVTRWYGAPPIFRLYVMEWDEAAHRPVGTIRHRSAPRTITTDAQESAASSMWLRVRPGGMYVAFLGTFDDPQPAGVEYQGLETMYFDSGEHSPYAGGSAVRLSTTGGETALTSERWEELAFGGEGGLDAEFSAEFSATPIPEPASMALLGTGLAGLAGAARRRRRRREPEETEE